MCLREGVARHQELGLDVADALGHGGVGPIEIRAGRAEEERLVESGRGAGESGQRRGRDPRLGARRVAFDELHRLLELGPIVQAAPGEQQASQLDQRVVRVLLGCRPQQGLGRRGFFAGAPAG